MPSGIFTLKQQELALGQGAWSAAPNYAGTFDGSTQYIVTPSSSNLSMGTGDFTIECWCFPNAQEVRGLFQTSPSAGLPGVQSGIGVYFTTSLTAWNVYLAGTNYTPTGLTLANQWTHIAITRSGTTSRFFVNGVLAQTVAGDTTNYTDTYFVIGGFLSTAYLWRGQISNFRVIKGTALYTAAFTPPQNALTAVSGTQLLTLQNPTIVDNSANNFSLTNTGTVTTSLQYPFSTIKPLAVDYLVVAGGGGAGASNPGGGGAGGLLQGSFGVATGSAITVTIGGGGAGNAGTGVPGSGSNSVFGSITATGGGGGGISTTAPAAGGSGGGGARNATYAAPGQGTSGQGFAGGTGGSGLGAGGGGGAGTVGLNGNSSTAGNGGAGVASDISGTRTTYAGGGGGSGNAGILGGAGGAGGGGAGATGGSNGTSGTVSTGGGGGGAENYTGGNGGSGIVIISYPDTYAAPASTTGSPTVSTSGSGSVYLNGSTDYMSVTTPALGSGDFTIEFWIYLNSVTTTFYYDGRGAGSSGLQPTVYYSSGLKYFTNGSDRINGAALSTGQWYHIAVSRVSGNTRMFINGTQTGSTYTDSNTYVASTTGSGWISGNGSFFTNGYITNLRIIVGTGLYSGTFTVPAAPLTAVSGTQLLLSSVSGSPFLDSSASARTVSIFGTPSWNQLSPFATGLGYKNRVYTWTSSGSITF